MPYCVIDLLHIIKFVVDLFILHFLIEFYLLDDE